MKTELPCYFRKDNQQECALALPNSNIPTHTHTHTENGGMQASIFTGEEEVFAFERTISRLKEMQRNEYWNIRDSDHSSIATDKHH